jgi:hypothetical protein
VVEEIVSTILGATASTILSLLFSVLLIVEGIALIVIKVLELFH